MARLPRYTIINQPQHIIQRGRGGKRIFRAEQDYQYYRDCLEAAAYNYELKVHAFALLPDRVHILVTPKRENSISRSIQSIGRNYVQYFNESYDDEGTLWEGATAGVGGESSAAASRRDSTFPPNRAMKQIRIETSR